MIPKAAIEAVAKRNFEFEHNYREFAWAELGDDIKVGWLREAEAQCEAAAPYLRAQALEDAADALDLPGTDATGYYSGECHSGYTEAERHAETWLRARAVTERT